MALGWGGARGGGGAWGGGGEWAGGAGAEPSVTLLLLPLLL